MWAKVMAILGKKKSWKDFLRGLKNLCVGWIIYVQNVENLCVGWRMNEKNYYFYEKFEKLWLLYV